MRDEVAFSNLGFLLRSNEQSHALMAFLHHFRRLHSYRHTYFSIHVFRTSPCVRIVTLSSISISQAWPRHEFYISTKLDFG